MAMAVERAFPHHLWEPELRISKSAGKERTFAPMRARARAIRAPMTEIRTPPRTNVNNPIHQHGEVNEGSPLNLLADGARTPISDTPIPWPGCNLQSNRVTPVVEEGPKVIFMNGQLVRSPLMMKRMRIDEENDDPGYGKLPTEFEPGPLPEPPAPKKRKLLAGTSGKRACRIPPVKWAPPSHFPSTSTSPIRTISTEWDYDDDDKHESPPIEEITPPEYEGSRCGCSGGQ